MIPSNGHWSIQPPCVYINVNATPFHIALHPCHFHDCHGPFSIPIPTMANVTINDFPWYCQHHHHHCYPWPQFPLREVCITSWSYWLFCHHDHCSIWSWVGKGSKKNVRFSCLFVIMAIFFMERRISPLGNIDCFPTSAYCSTRWVASYMKHFLIILIVVKQISCCLFVLLSFCLFVFLSFCQLIVPQGERAAIWNISSSSSSSLSSAKMILQY